MSGHGFTHKGRWAPSIGAWIAAGMNADLAEILCEQRDWTPIEVFVLSNSIAAQIDDVVSTDGSEPTADWNE